MGNKSKEDLHRIAKQIVESQERPQWSNNETKDTMIQKTIMKGQSDLLQQVQNEIGPMKKMDTFDSNTQKGLIEQGYNAALGDISKLIAKKQNEITSNNNQTLQDMLKILRRL